MKNKIFRVSIVQYCKPITVFAKDEDDARNKATEDHVWEVEEASFDIEEINKRYEEKV